MRTTTAGERTAAGGSQLNQYARLEVTDPDGAWRDVSTSLSSPDWFNSAEISENIDGNTMTFSAELLRDSGTLSLVPLHESSTVNRNAANLYAPMLDLVRKWRLSVAVVTQGAAVAAGDWKEIGRGYIDTIEVDDQRPTIRITGRGEEARMLDTEILAEVEYSPASNQTLEAVIQALLNNNLTSPPTIYVPAAMNFVINRYTQQVGNLMGAITALANEKGAVIRYKYDSANSNRLTLFVPDRTATAGGEVWTIGPSEYLALPVNRLDVTGVRNYVRVTYLDATSGNPATVNAPASGTSPSITSYGTRAIVIELAADSQITTSARATAFADVIRADLEFPSLQQQFETYGLWFVQLHDYGKLSANGVHYTVDQYGGVTGVRHQLANGEVRTVVDLGGQPKGRYKVWRTLADPPVNTGTIPGVPEVLFISPPVPLYDGTSQIGWVIEGAVDSETNGLELRLVGDLTLISAIPAGVQIAGAEYRLDTSAFKGFEIKVAQAAGAAGEVQLTPRGTYSTVAGTTSGGLTGTDLFLPLVREPVTEFVVTQQKDDPVTGKAVYAVTFSVQPVSSSLTYRMKVGAGVFGPWYTVTPGGSAASTPPYLGYIDPNGRYTEWSVPVGDGDVVIEFHATSVSGVKEALRTIVVDQNTGLTFALLPPSEDVAGVISATVTIDAGDLIQWKLWARRATSPVVGAEPDDRYLIGTFSPNNPTTRFAATAGTWYLHARGYSKVGMVPSEQTFVVAGAGVTPTVGSLTGIQAYVSTEAALTYNDLRWTPNAVVEAGGFIVRITENAVELVSTAAARDARTDHDATTGAGTALIGGWHRQVTTALSTAANAEYKTFNYVIELRTSIGALVATYNASISGWYAGSGGAGEGTAPATTPPVPTLSNTGLLNALKATWAGSANGFEVVIDWEESDDFGTTWLPVAQLTLSAGASEHTQAGLATNYRGHARLAYKNTAGQGPWSAYSAMKKILGSGSGGIEPGP